MRMTRPQEAPQACKLQLESVWPAQFQLVVLRRFWRVVGPTCSCVPKLAVLRLDASPSGAGGVLAALAAGQAFCQRTIAGNGSARCHAGVRRPVNFEWLASKLKVVGGVCPSGLSIRLLLSKVDNDEKVRK